MGRQHGASAAFDPPTDFVQGACAQAGSGADEYIGISGSVFGAVGQGDIEDSCAEVGVFSEVADHLRDCAGMGVGVVVEQDDELTARFADGDVFRDGAAVFVQADQFHLPACLEFLRDLIGRAVGGGVVDHDDFELFCGQAVGDHVAEAIDHDRSAVVRCDGEGDENRHALFIDRKRRWALARSRGNIAMRYNGGLLVVFRSDSDGTSAGLAAGLGCGDS